MALHNGTAGAAGGAGTARRHAKLQKRATLTSSSPAFQLFLEQRPPALQNSTSPEIDPKSAILNKSPTTSLALRPRNHGSLPSLAPKFKRTSLGKPLVPSKLARLARRHRGLERALRSFLLRRQLWRRTRRPIFNMDFIDHIRRIQADEPSSDEDSGSFLPPVPTKVSRRQSSAPATDAAATPGQLTDSGATSPKRKRNSAAATEEAPTKTSLSSMEVKTTEPSGARQAKKAEDQTTSPTDANNTQPAPLANGTKSPKKRALADRDTAGEGEQRAAKRVKPEDRSSSSSSTKLAAAAKASPESSKGTPAATPPVLQKPVDRMEYFERRVHDMLTDPLDFDDFVYDSNKPIPRHVLRDFARNRRGQKQPPPPLEMSGAAGPASGAKQATKPKSKGPGSLAKEAQKRAHQQKVTGQVDRLKGKGVASSEPGRGIKRSVGGQQLVKSKANVGKRKERAWLTNTRKVERGAQQPQTRVKKYTQSAYFDVPTLSSAIAPGLTMRVEG